MSGLVKFAAGAIAALVISGGAAQASTWVIDYTANSASATPQSATLDLQASDALNSVKGFDVVKILSGNVDGDTITGLVANPNDDTQATSPDGLFYYDNVVWPGATEQLSSPGILFLGASGAEYNLFSDVPASPDGPVTYELYKAVGGQYAGNSQGTITMGQTFDRGGPTVGVPEPAAWTMMILGFGAVGAVLRRRRQGAAFTPA